MKFIKYIIGGLLDCIKATAGGDTEYSLYQGFVAVCFLVMIICLYFLFDCFFSRTFEITGVWLIFLSILADIILVSLFIGILSLIEFFARK